MLAQYAYQKTAKPDTYLNQKILSASPNQLIAYIYDAGITACLRKDREKARKAVYTLMDALNYDHKETATVFFNVYRNLNRLLSRGKFDESKEIFMDLKKTWTSAMKVS